jgi:hypothetical protein
MTIHHRSEGKVYDSCGQAAVSEIQQPFYIRQKELESLKITVTDGYGFGYMIK